MKVAYFECLSGISGDMVVGALLDAGLKLEELEEELKKLNLSGYALEAKKISKKGIRATKFKVQIEEQGVERRFKDILFILEQSKLEKELKEQAIQIFYRLAQAESKIHQKEIEKIHFHEVGGIDAIIDITSAVIGIRKLGIQEIYASALPLGKGFIECAHGIIPVPAPATLELLKNIPTYDGKVKSEMVTPTGAAIISTLAKGFGERPFFHLETIGYGAGEKEFDIPNLLRINIGQKWEEGKSISDLYLQDKLILLETNLDNMNPEFYDYIMERLFSVQALEVFLTPLQMKKNRPGCQLSVLIVEENLSKALEIIFAETTTLGVRVKEVKRFKLERKVEKIKTRFGEVRVKIGVSRKEIKNIAPEYEDCKKIAKQWQVSLKEVYEEAKRVAEEKFK
ncbi:MAG: nickel pincer cofactor biosynthesis protein LarC [Candidatus Caldatribacteriota bacterium]